MAVCIAMLMITATYAWFTANREVNTDKITTKVGTDQFILQISRTGGAEFKSETDKDASGTEYGKVNLAPLGDGKVLMPVSTADLKTFVYCPYTNNDNAEVFLPAKDESLYYHDTVYLRATGEGLPQGTQVSLYLDNVPIVEAKDGELLTASRLGLTFNDANPVIFRLSEKADTGSGNTSVPGFQDGNVLSYDSGSGKPVAKADPAIALSQRQISGDGAQPMMNLELNQIYKVDIYFYLEGCDPDCLSDRVGRDEAMLQLGFFGMPKQEGEQ